MTNIDHSPTSLIYRIKKGLSFLEIVIFFLALSGIWYFFANKDNFPINKVDIYIDNVSFYHDAQNCQSLENFIQQSVRKGNFFTNDLFFLAQNIKEKFPYIKNVKINRKFPDNIQIALNFRKEVAIWNDNFLLDNEGEIFPFTTFSYFANLPKLLGDDLSFVLENFQKANKYLRNSNLVIRSFLINKQGDVFIILQNGVMIVSETGSLEKNLKTFQKIYSLLREKNANKTLSYIDFRYSNGFSVLLF